MEQLVRTVRSVLMVTTEHLPLPLVKNATVWRTTPSMELVMMLVNAAVSLVTAD
jgi:hypothetical protein